MAAARLQRWLLGHWFAPGPTWLAHAAAPLAWLYGRLARRDRLRRERLALAHARPGVPVVVVGNVVIGGAGKTPCTLAVLQALQQAGRRPGVVSRGQGRKGGDVLEVDSNTPADRAGDEPLLIARRSGAPVVVGDSRAAAVQALLQRHPEVDTILADDGLQHRQLHRDLEIVVFDSRGLGNGRLLPAGPLREPWNPQAAPSALVLYSEGRASTPCPGHLATRHLSGMCPLADWWRGQAPVQALERLRGRRLMAMAGLAVPERFFVALESAGLQIERLPLPDHHPYERAPWPASAQDIVTTEKDAVKLRRYADAGPRIWVVGLDLSLPAAFVAELLARTAPKPPP